jgi:hypothetical protein
MITDDDGGRQVMTIPHLTLTLLPTDVNKAAGPADATI